MIYVSIYRYNIGLITDMMPTRHHPIRRVLLSIKYILCISRGNGIALIIVTADLFADVRLHMYLCISTYILGIYSV